MPLRNNGPAPLAIFPFTAWLPSITGKSLANDLVAGLTSAIMVIPQGVAFAMIAGLPPEYGLYTAIVPPIIAGLFGSSHHLISGPATAMSIVTYSVISPYAAEGSAEFITLAFTLTFLAGLIQFTLGVARMGVLVNFISHSVVVGFTAGAAILIATSQASNIAGVTVPRGESFLHLWLDILKRLSELNPYSIAVAIITVAVVIFFKIFRPRWPGMIFGMIAGGVTAALLGAQEKGIALVGSLPSSLPPFSAPDLSGQTLHNIIPGALARSILGLIEAVSISRSIALKSGQRIDGDQEFIGQGLANIVGAFFSCYASSGSFTRSGLNYDSGAKTPMSAVFAGISLALVLLMVAPLAAYLPMPAMGGIVLVVACNLVDYRQIKVILKASRTDSSVLIVTFLATLFVKLEFAIYVGVILSLVLYLNRTSKPAVVTRAPDPASPRRNMYTISSGPECIQMKIVRVDGSLYAGRSHGRGVERPAC